MYLHTLMQILSKKLKVFREGGRILRLGGPKIFFPGRGFSPLRILEFFFLLRLFPPKNPRIFFKAWLFLQILKFLGNLSLETTIQGWVRVINYLSWTLEARQGKNIGGPWPPSNSLPVKIYLKSLIQVSRSQFYYAQQN